MLIKGHLILLTAHQLEKAWQAYVTLTYSCTVLQRHGSSEATGGIRGLWQFEILWLHHAILKQKGFTVATPKMARTIYPRKLLCQLAMKHLSEFDASP